ncbi:MAG TPA: MTAP family purine nucleoside phosphorylase [Candidatus Thermoplasmatota archaeon]|nr:MTAP family purine nucleoside phosphorylase [Candidatus Thermoplasmatota archaeon]
MNIGILCGHLLPDLVKKGETISVETPYGPVVVQVSSLGNHELFFIQRHGAGPGLPPHKVNYRGNIQALCASHVSCILSVSTVGSMIKQIQPGELVIPHDFLDMTKSRPATFYDDTRVHVDMTDPFCPDLRLSLLEACKATRTKYHDKGVYLATEGPRLETVAEINFFSGSADIVGMTLVPEVVLAREKGICFAALCLACNMAAGLQHRLPADDIVNVFTKQEPMIAQVLRRTIESLDEHRSCHCAMDITKATL